MSGRGVTVPEVAALVALLVILALLMVCSGLLLPFDLLGNLLIGWIFFLRRTLPGVTISGPGLATAAVCLAGFSIGLHAFLRWLVGAIPEEDGSDEPVVRRWPWRWTAAMVGLVVLLFVAGLAATGIAHQAGWLLTSPEPWVASSFDDARGAAVRTQSMNNLRQMGIALENYQQEHGRFPPGGTFDATGRGWHGWQARLLAGMDRPDLYHAINFAVPWDEPANTTALTHRVNEFLRPRTEPQAGPSGYALSHYAGNVHVLGGDTPWTLGAITDGASATILAGEAAGRFRPWGHPANWRDPALGLNRTPDGFGSPIHGANLLMADGSVRFLKDTVDPQVLKALSTPSGGERVASDAD